MEVFFGSGTEINVRQLKAKGVINNKIRFSIGDLFLKQSKFTLYNYDEELLSYENDMLKFIEILFIMKIFILIIDGVYKEFKLISLLNLTDL